MQVKLVNDGFQLHGWKPTIAKPMYMYGDKRECAQVVCTDHHEANSLHFRQEDDAS